jgi:alkylresorcinol/alkylpyrone synthase
LPRCGRPTPSTKADVARLARTIFGPKFGDFERLAKVFATTGILQRQAVRPMEWYEAPRGWLERTEAYLDAGTTLFIEAAQAALAAAGLKAADVDTVVTVSSTGIATPSLEARALADLGLRPDVQRVPVFGLGCAGGVSGLSLAARLARAEPGSSCSSLRSNCAPSPSARTVPRRRTSLRRRCSGTARSAPCCGPGGDGAGPDRRGRLRVHLAPPSISWAGPWTPVGLGVIFDRAIPPFVTTEYGKAVAALLNKTDLKRETIDRFVCHPGGTKVVAALEGAPDLQDGTLDVERAVLRDHGNMSAPTALFVLDRVLRSGFEGRAVLSALGPGFTASFVSLRVPETPAGGALRSR